MSSRELQDRTQRFAVAVVRFSAKSPKQEPLSFILLQLMRAATSVGANYRATCRSRSRPEFIARLGIVCEEADETVYWLEILGKSDVGNSRDLQPLLQEARELTAIFSTSVRTARQRLAR